MTSTLHVWWDGRLVGALQTNQHGEMRFTYDPVWLLDQDSPPRTVRPWARG